ncbi:MmgE/PrpD family protein [Phaeobacter sp. CECT 5382]|uniref:MmgE/PrpD family protein n=1 Tax=Phaeobacter sp. CECT 5382 TaxID=1712645 RepID=UPI0006DA4FAD|nr:MmgE/PrpD family protein [Phaeobacter sp. CECT 5382]CUH88405.1 MmgE/PrpD family protein [Phaeobacter sp. CECT 5382]
MTTSILQPLADFATVDLQPSALATNLCRLSALDWMACAIAGTDEPVSRILLSQALSEAGQPQASLFGGEQGLESGPACAPAKVPARMAALANGTISHALDYDDTHFDHIGHPSVAVFPAAFAIGEKTGKPLSEILQAALFGMELSIRVGLWLGRSHYQAGFHQTATAGAFGATTAAGRLLGLDAAQMAMALGLAATRAAGLKAQFGTMGKPYNAGLAATAGVEVAELIAAGFEANAAALDGPLGFGATHHGEDQGEAALKGLGEVWRFETVSHKFHACCHGLHAALEAARTLDLAAPEIASLTVRTHPRWMTVCNQPSPATGLGAKFSYRTVLAMQALGMDTARLESYSDAVCANPKLVALRNLIQVEPDETITETEAHVALLRRDGKRFEARHNLQAPQDYAEREARVLAKADALIGAARAAAIWSRLQNDLLGQDCTDFFVA